MGKFNLIPALVFLFVASVATAQSNAPGDVPPNAEPGKCYAKCLIADEYETLTEQIETKAASTRTEIIPAQYETVTEQALKTAEATRLVAVPAEYETVTEQVISKAESTRIITVPAEYETVTETYEMEAASTRIETLTPKYETVTEQVQVSPASTKWVKKKGDPSCLSADPNDCLVWCLVEVPATFRTVTKRMNVGCDGSGVADAGCVKEVTIPAKMGTRTRRVVKTPATQRTEVIPAEYKTVTKQVVKTPATFREEIIPAEYKTVTKRVVKTPASTREEIIPAEYKTVTRRVVKTPASVREEAIPAEYATVSKKVVKSPASTRTITVPAEYQTVTKRNLVKQGGFTEWKEVLCESKVNSATVRQIQAALRDRGYDPGPIDNVMGARTRAALTKYQKDNGLPIGSLDLKTLQSLGVNY